MTDVASIAEGLSEAQRDTMMGHMVEIPPEEAEQLQALGLKKPSFEMQQVVTKRVWPITTLGLAVRKHLGNSNAG